MKSWKDVLVSAQTSLRDAAQVLDANALQIVLVVDENRKLLGTVTDGDIRRAILSGISLADSVQNVMNSNPTFARVEDSKDSILAEIKRKSLNHMPIVDQEGRVVGLDTLAKLITPKIKQNRVVLMAGGLGSRLRPLTNDCPKPMLKVGGKPLLETIIENFIEHGFHRFYISVNYMSEVVKDYFGDGSRWGVDIVYLHEDQKLGTAGALSLLPERPAEPLLVMNGDLLTKVNFCQLLDFHISHQAMGTMCVREYDFQVPYGVVKIENHRIAGIDEKPVQRFFVNAGIYVLQPDTLNMIAPNTFFDMPSLFERLIEKQAETAVFPVREYWLDIGHMADFDRANGEYTKVFE